MSPLVSIIILNYKGKKFLKDCLDSVFVQSFTDFEVIFVDNASGDGSIDYVEELFAKQIREGQLKLVANTQNDGFAEGNNVGVRNSSLGSKYICLLNNDTIVEKDWLKYLVEPIEKDESIGMVGSLVLPAEDSESLLNLYLNRHLGVSWNVFSECVLQDISLGEIESNFMYTIGIGGCALLYKREIIKEPFPDFYFAYAEDTYLSMFMLISGYKTGIALNSRLIHYGGGTKYIDPWVTKISIFNGTKNQIINFLLFLQWSTIVLLFPLFIIHQIARLLFNLKGGIVRLKAYWWVIFNIAKILELRKKVQMFKRIKDIEILNRLGCDLILTIYFDSRYIKGCINIINFLFKKYILILKKII